MNYILCSILIVFSVVIIYFEIYTLKRKSVQLILTVLFFCCIIFYCVGYAFELLANSLDRMLFWNEVQYIGTPFIPSLFLIFLLYVNNNKKFLSPFWISVILFIPIFSLIARYTNALHQLYYKSYYIKDIGFPVLILVTGPFVIPLYIHQIFCCMGGGAILIQNINKQNGYLPTKFAKMLLAAMVTPFFTFLLNIFEISHIDWVPLSFLISALHVIFYSQKNQMQKDKNMLLYELQTNESILRMVLESIDNIIILFDNKNKKAILVNDRYKQLFGTVLDTDLGQAKEQLLSRVYPEDKASVEKFFSLLGNIDCRIQKAEYRLRNGEGTYIWARSEIRAIDCGTLSTDLNIFSITNISEEHTAFEELVKKAEFDATGVYNRATILEKIQYLLENSESSKKANALVLFDIDNLKRINDTYGHSMGDKIIEGLTKILHYEIGKESILGRLGGDEFLAFIQDVPSKEYIKQMLTSIIMKCSDLQYVYNLNLPVTVSGGVVEVGDNNVPLQELYEKADAALYKVKNNEKNGFCFYADIKETGT